MEVERLLAGKFFMQFRLLKTRQFNPLQKEVDEMPLPELKERYADLVRLARNRDMRHEYEQRNQFRVARGKTALSFQEDYLPTLFPTARNGANVCCSSPWRIMDIDLDGQVTICSWLNSWPQANYKNYMKKDGSVAWERLFNSPRFKKVRWDMLHNRYPCCMPTCELNSYLHPIESSLERHEKAGGESR